MIPQAAPHLRLARHGAEIEERVRAVLRDGRLMDGPALAAFEQAFAVYTGAAHCVGVNSGTDAVALSLRALGIGPGDEVVTVSMTAAGTGMGILLAGAEPRFADVDPVTRCMDVASAQALIGPRTAALVPVHLHGHAADLDGLEALATRHGLAIVEDCAQAHGLRPAGGRHVGTRGALGAFSFYPTKNLGCAGDGGAIVTSDDALARRLRALRSYGWEDDARVSTMAGANSRLDELQAAVLAALLPHLDAVNHERRTGAAAYAAALRDTPAGLPREAPDAVHHQYAVTVAERDRVRADLQARGIGTGVHYPVPLHRQPAFAAHCGESLPVTDDLAARMISLPIQPEVAAGHEPAIAEALAACLTS